jgi:bifunctional non-homologous end joining protein LigD
VNRRSVDVAGQRLTLSNLEKDLYPLWGFTKARVLEYYRRISPFILPHLKDRALTMKRYPEGTAGDFFFEKRCPGHRPSWVETADLPLDDGEKMTACLANSLETLIWLANLAALELHVPMARASSPDTPDFMVFDLDPGEGADILLCRRIALTLRDLLSHMDLTSYPKTSGKKGLHVYVPLNGPEATFEQTKTFSKAVADLLQRNYPDLVTAKMAKEYRKGRVFINWSQNDRSKTMICVYSLRGLERPTVSFPLAWAELENISDTEDPVKLQITQSEALRRIEREGDLFGDVILKRQTLPHL